MIHTLTGLIQKASKQAIIMQVGPIGFELVVPDGLNYQVGSQQTVQVYMHWNAEQGPSFYGFSCTLHKQVFLLIITCSGIGPKIGLAVLADLGAEQFLEAVQTGNERALSSVTGIGAKKAEQMIVHLKHKVGQLLDSGVSLSVGSRVMHWQTVSQALESLNYSRQEINHALSQLKHDTLDGDVSFDILMRRALSLLSKQP